VELAERAEKSRGKHFDGRKTISGGVGGGGERKTR